MMPYFDLESYLIGVSTGWALFGLVSCLLGNRTKRPMDTIEPTKIPKLPQGGSGTAPILARGKRA